MKQHPNSRIVLPDIHHLKTAPYPDSISQLSRLVLTMAHIYGLYSFTWMRPLGGGGLIFTYEVSQPNVG